MRIFSRSFRVIIPFVLVWVSCQEKEEPDCCTNIDTSFRFNVLDSDQLDLLDPSNPEHLKLQDLVVSFLLDGEKVEVYDSKINHLRSFPRIIEPEPLAGVDKYVLNVILNSSKDEEMPTTYLEWKDGSVDTLEAEFHRSSNTVILIKLWLNGDLIYDTAAGIGAQFYPLVKDFEE